MKTQNYGIAHTTEAEDLTLWNDLCRLKKIKAPSKRRMILKRIISRNPTISINAQSNYIKSRENGQEQDSPSRPVPMDGKVECIQEADVQYTEGPGDKEWMEEKDRNYISRLARERHQRQLTAEESADFEEGMQRVDISERVNKEEKVRESETISQDKLSETTNQNRGEAKMKILNLVTLLKAIKANSIEEVDLSEQLPDYQNTTIERTLTGHSSSILALQILSNERLASGSYDKTIRIWNTETGECERTLTEHSSYIYALQILPNKRLASGDEKGTIRIWNIETGACDQMLTGHSNSIWALQILSNERLASGSDDKTIRIWNTETGEYERTLTGHLSYIRALQILSNGKLASGSYDHTIRIWNTETGACERTLTGHSSTIWALQILPNGKLASGGQDNTIRIWNTETGECERTLTGHSGCIEAFQILPNTRLASGSNDKTIRIWNTETGTCEQMLTGHSSSISALQILPNGKLASGSDDHTIRIWKPNYCLVKTQEFTEVIIMLYSNTSVKILNLCGLNLNIQNIQQLMKLLQTNNQLECIDLSGSNFNDVFAEVLIPALQQNNSLKQLNVLNTVLSVCVQEQIKLLFLKKSDTKNNTILHLAAREGYFEYIQKYITLKLEDYSKKNDEGKTPLDLARENHHKDVVKYLERFISVQQTPEQIEQLQKQLETVKQEQIVLGECLTNEVTQKIETVESQQQVLQEQLTADVTTQVESMKKQQARSNQELDAKLNQQTQHIQTQQKKYAEKTIEQAIEARDWLLFKTLVKAKADLRCINCIPYLEELQAQGLTIEVLEECGAICDLPQLQTVTKDTLSRIETHPKEVKYLQRLYTCWQELIEGCQQDTLKNSTVAHQINANALTKLITVWYEGQLPVILQEKVQTYLHSSSIRRHQQWLQNRLPETIQQQLDQKISKVLWEQWKTQRHNDFPAQEQLAQNVLIVFKEHYKKQQLSKILTTAIDRKIIAEVIEQIKTNSLPKVLAETLQPIADQLSQGKLITNMLPIYEQAMQQLINQWKSDELTEPTAAIIDGLATKVIAEIHPEPKLREQLDEEAVQLLLAQLKQNQLPEEVQSPLIQQTQDTISHLKPTEGQLNQALNKLLIEYKTNKSQFSQEEQAFLEDVILGEWKQLMEQLKMYAYPVAMVQQLKQQVEVQAKAIEQLQDQMQTLIKGQQVSETQKEKTTTNTSFFNAK